MDCESGYCASVCDTGNELHLEDAKHWLQTDVLPLQRANMPTQMEATEYLQANGVLFAPESCQCRRCCHFRIGDVPEQRTFKAGLQKKQMQN